MTAIEFIGACIGLLYLRLEYRASIRLWPVGVLMSLFYVYIFFESRLYAVMSINVYYLIAGIYGWLRWQRGASSGGEMPIGRFPLRYAFRLAVVSAGLFGLIAWLLLCFTDSPVPWGDALTTALSIAAMWMLARKYAEQWLLWVVINSLSAGLYAGQGLYPTAVLYAVYAVVAVFGYRKWKEATEFRMRESTSGMR
jgi:nicotinamide mononucleotide transporter